MPITGCAYYPEHWNPERWELDAQLMRDAGLQVVRLAEFAWDKIEPAPEIYDFEWLDTAVEILSRAGLQIVMCTPTPTPPPWLTNRYPEICRVREDGVRISPGGRRHACANVPAYQDASRQIAEAITKKYGQHPAVIGWQIDNEFGCGETTRCYCDYCREAFHHWLKDKYETLHKLNAAWGSQFWGATYELWYHIPIPGITTEPQSPALRLDYRRFSSDSWVKFQQMQVDIIRRNAPERWITHNFMIRHWSLDYWKLAQDLDFVSYDNYPHGLRDAAEVSMNLDLMWSLKRRSFWIMEQQTGRVNWHPYNPPVPKGQIKAWSHQAVAHGAESVVYFRYRASRFGQEQHHAGLLKWNAALDQAYHEAKEVSQTFGQHANFTRHASKVGIVFDYEDLWAIEMEPHHQDFSYWNLVYEIYKHFWDANIAVDFLPRNADPTGYELIILPAGILTRPGEAEKWRSWVEPGERLVITFRTGMREPSSIAVETALPAGMTDLIGAEVEDFYTVPPKDFIPWQDHRPGTHIDPVEPMFEDDVRVETPAPQNHYKIWAETLKPTTAEPLFVYGDGMLEGKPAVTVNEVGSGEVIYVGCWVNDWQVIFGQQPAQPVQQAILSDDDGTFWRISINHAAEAASDLAGFGVQYEPIEEIQEGDML